MKNKKQKNNASIAHVAVASSMIDIIYNVLTTNKLYNSQKIIDWGLCMNKMVNVGCPFLSWALVPFEKKKRLVHDDRIIIEELSGVS